MLEYRATWINPKFNVLNEKEIPLKKLYIIFCMLLKKMRKVNIETQKTKSDHSLGRKKADLQNGMQAIEVREHA